MGTNRTLLLAGAEDYIARFVEEIELFSVYLLVSTLILHVCNSQ